MAKRKGKKSEEVSFDAVAIHSPTSPIDPEVEREFSEAGRARDLGGRKLAEKLLLHNSKSPSLSAGDIDAAWDQDSGEECACGSTPTPDQDVVEEIGEAMGLTFQDNEPVDTPGKLARRDLRRWELEPASAEDFKERQADLDAIPKNTA